MSELKLYGFSPSTYTRTAMLVAAEAGAQSELLPLEFKKPSHLRLHPYGKMPVLQHGDVILFETLAIATYLDGAFGGQRLQPKEAAPRAKMMQWISVAIDYAYEDLVNGLHDDAPSSDAVAAAGQQLKLLDGAIGTAPYFAGQDVSLADLFLFPMVEFTVSKLGVSALKGLPALKRWHAALAARPSTRKVASS